MQQYLIQLRSLHDELIAALDGGDVEQVSALVGRRAELIEELRRAFAASGDEARQAIQPELTALLPLDRDLQSRAGTLRELLRAEIGRQRDPASRNPRPTVTGILDRQA